MNNCIVLKGGRLIDGLSDSSIDNGAVVIKDDLIEAAGDFEAIKIPPEAELIDTKGKTMMPGLIDAHLHLMGLRSMSPMMVLSEPTALRGMRMVMDAWKLLDCGFTTIRDCGNAKNLCFNLNKVIVEGTVIGPRIVSCGEIICQTGGHGDLAHFLPMDWVKQRGIGRFSDGVDECRKAAREQLREGADFIKLCSSGGVLSEKDLPGSCQYTVEEISAIVEEARNAGVKTASHALANRGIRNALLAGVNTIEHGFYMDAEIIETMLRQGTYYIPTLAIIDAIVTRGPEAGVPEYSLKKAREHQEAHFRSFDLACRAGVKIGCGTDYNGSPITPMGDNAIELELQVKAGRTPMEVIVSATKINAEALGLEDNLGTLAAGKLADLIVVNGDPLKDITILRDREKIVDVYKGGVRVPRLNMG